MSVIFTVQKFTTDIFPLKNEIHPQSIDIYQ
jgi:hypothetical protein